MSAACYLQLVSSSLAGSALGMAIVCVHFGTFKSVTGLGTICPDICSHILGGHDERMGS